MYFINTEVVIDWHVLKSSTTVPVGLLGLLLMRPDGTTSYIDSTQAGFEHYPSTGSSDSLVRHKITPHLPGLWKLFLVYGVSSNYEVLSRVNMHVFEGVSSTPNYHVHVDYTAPPPPPPLGKPWQAVDYAGDHHPPGLAKLGQAVWVPEGEYWRTVGYYSYFRPVGGWEVGYRPASVSVSIDASQATSDSSFVGLQVFNTDLTAVTQPHYDTYDENNNFTATTEMLLDFGVDNLDILQLRVVAYNYIENIFITDISTND